MPSGRWRIDEALDLWHTRRQQHDPTQHFDDISEVPGPAQDVEKDPPEYNEDSGLASSVTLPDPVPVIVVPGGVPEYRRSGWHGYTVTCYYHVAKQIAVQQDHRRRLWLRNFDSSGTGTDYAIYIGSTPEEAIADGFPIPNGNTELIETTDEIWGYVKDTSLSATDWVLVGVRSEYEWPVS